MVRPGVFDAAHNAKHTASIADTISSTDGSHITDGITRVPHALSAPFEPRKSARLKGQLQAWLDEDPKKGPWTAISRIQPPESLPPASSVSCPDQGGANAAAPTDAGDRVSKPYSGRGSLRKQTARGNIVQNHMKQQFSSDGADVGALYSTSVLAVPPAREEDKRFACYQCKDSPDDFPGCISEGYKRESYVRRVS